MFSRFIPGHRRRLKSHLVFQVGDQKVAYCYIRKNACSAFKRMLLDRAGYTGDWHGSMAFLIRTYSPSNVAEVRAAPFRIFVYRDPFDRAASLFRNKMVMQDGAVDILPNYQAITRSDPADATFERFVEDYLTQRRIDPHARSHSSHLLPIEYNCVSTLETLFADMREIVGETLASQYFKAPTNISSAKLSDEPSSSAPVRILRERYASTGELPSTAALRTPQIETLIRRIYSEDYKLQPRRLA